MQYLDSLRTYLLISLCLLASFLPLRAQINFTTGRVSGTSLYNPTSLQYGPDGKLYVSTQDGTIYRYTVQKTSTGYHVLATEVINLIKQIPNHNDDGTLNTLVTTRQVTGILVTGTASSPNIYVTSSDPRIGGSGTEGSSAAGDGDLNLDTNSGTLSLLSWDGSAWTKTDLVHGMPRSEENHSQNGLTLDPATNSLYITSGGSTNAGSPSVNFAKLTEYALSACLLKVDLNMLNSMPVIGTGNSKYIYNLPTVDDPTRTNSGNADINDPFGGNDGRNQAKIVPGGPVQVYAPGYRNIYDVVITKTAGREGRIYTIDNGPNQGWGGYPDEEGTAQVTNNYVTGEPGSLGPGVNDAQVNNLDGLHLISKPGMAPVYGGHPVPIRANPAGAGLFWQDAAGPHFEITPTTDWPPLPISMADPVQGDYQNPGVNDGSLTTFYTSTNGITEYTSSALGGQMTGDLLTVSFSGEIIRIKMTADGSAVSSKTTLASGFGSTPLDIVAQGDDDIFPGTIWVADYVDNAIYFFEPVVPATSNNWSAIIPTNGVYPENRHENAFVEAGAKLYLLGGRGSKPVNVFDPGIKTWTTVAPIPNQKELHHFQAVSLNNKIYILNAFTGAYPSETPVPDIYIYDIATNTWTINANAIPAGRSRGSGATVVYNNKIYLAGGIVNGHNSGTVNWTDVYDPATNSWTTLENAPHLRDHVHGSLINGKIYLAGGRRTSASTGVLFTDTEGTVDVYDIATNAWTTLPASSNIPTPRAGAASVAYNNQLVIIGGESAQSVAHNQVQQLDPATNSWTSLPNLTTGRHGTQAVTYAGQIFIAAGSSSQGGNTSTELNSIEVYPTTASSCSGDTTSTTLDDDGDGYSNKDETDNNTDPCSAASKPKDFDGDFLSNLNDTDDDNDGIPDVIDPFHIDNQNGKNKLPPFTYPFLNGNPGTGLFGMGFTGLMGNGTDPDKLYDENADGFIMGGAAGLASVPATSGSPISNTQQQAFQFGVMMNSSSPVTTMEVGLVSPYFNTINPSLLKDELHGTFIGSGDQDNYIMLALTPNFGNPAIAVIQESGGSLTQNLYPTTGLLNANLQLYIEINPAAGTVQPKYKRNTDGAPVNAGPAIALTGKLLTTVQGQDAVAMGILASSRTGSGFSATWDYMNVFVTNDPTASNTKRINAGGPTVSAGGQTWSEDMNYTDANPTYPSQTYSTTEGISNTAIPIVYQTERYGQAFNYSIPIANGNYTVRLHFAELYWTAAGQRVFNVDVENGQGSLTNFDIFAEAGHHAALVKSFTANILDGVIDINFTTVKDMAKISGIEIVPGSANSVKPVANAGTDKNITLPTNSITLDGSGTDPDGSITGYTWSQVSGPNTAMFSSTTVAVPTLSNLIQGVYVFSLVVQNNSNTFSDPDQVTVTVNGSSGGGANVSYRINSGGPELNINGVNWTADQYYADVDPVSPSRTYSVSNAITNTTTQAVYQTERYGQAFNYNIPVTNGSYTVNLHFAELYWTAAGQRLLNVNVENGQGSLSNFDPFAEAGGRFNAVVKSFTVNVSDGILDIAFTSVKDLAKISGIEIVAGTPTSAKPLANAGADKNITLPTNSITLDGSGTDPDGSITDYTWSQVSGPNAAMFSSTTVAVPTVTNLIQGVYVFSLVVQDNSNTFSDPDQVTVTVNGSSGGGTTASYRINGGGPELNINGVIWLADQFFSGTSYTAYHGNAIANTTSEEIYRSERFGSSFGYNVPVPNGNYVVRLHFAEIYYSASGQRVFNVNVENGQGILSNFDIFATTGGNTAVVREYTVSVSDGNVSLSFSAVTDQAKISGIEILPSTTPPVTNAQPIANAGADQTITAPTNAVVLSGSGTDADGTVNGYAWTQVSGPNTATFSSLASASPTVSNLIPGVYVFSLVVIDDDNASSNSDQVTVTVSAGSTGGGGGNSTYWINSGGPAILQNGVNWSADQFFSGSTYAGGNVRKINNVLYKEIYKTARFGNAVYSIPVPSGTYQVTLYFAEGFKKAARQRIFNVNIENGQGSLNNFDIYATSGANIAVLRTFSVGVSDGNLTISLTGVTDEALICGIEVKPALNSKSLNLRNALLTRETGSPLKLKAAPNPSSNEFRLSFGGGDGTPIDIRIVNSTGSLVEQFRNADPARTISIGHDYASGTYHVEVIQSGNRTVGTLIRL